MTKTTLRHRAYALAGALDSMLPEDIDRAELDRELEAIGWVRPPAELTAAELIANGLTTNIRIWARTLEAGR